MKRWISAALMCLFATPALAQPYLMGDAWVNRLPASGDVASPAGAVSTGTIFWSGGVVPLQFNAALSPEQRTQVARVCGEWAKVARVACVDKTPSHGDWVDVSFGSGGCSAFVGRSVLGGSVPLNLGVGCWFDSVMYHELGHIFGLQHEHQRSDAGSYVDIFPANIQPGFLFAFTPFASTSLTPYDFRSIMHYSSFAFSNGFGPTILPKPAYASEGPFMGLSQAPTANDVTGLQSLYGATPYALPTPQAPSMIGLGGNSIQLSWSAPPAYPSATYAVELSPDASFLIPIRTWLFGTGTTTVVAGSIWKGLVWARIIGYVGTAAASASIPMSGTTVGAETAPWFAEPRVVGNNLELGWYGHGTNFTLDFRTSIAGPIVLSVPVAGFTWSTSAPSGTFYATVTDSVSRTSGIQTIVIP